MLTTQTPRTVQLSEALKQRFWSKVLIIDDEDSCWPWQGGLQSKGYGRFYADGVMWLSHVVSYILEHGEVPAALNVLHTCDNRPCVRPKHLYAGTQSQNMADAIARGRWVPRRTRLTVEQDIEIASLYRAGGITMAEIGALYGVKQQTIWRALCRQEGT